MSFNELQEEAGNLHARVSALPADLSEKQRRIAEMALRAGLHAVDGQEVILRVD